MLDTGVAGTTSVALVDVNGDGIPDIISAGNAVGVHLGLGRGRFRDPIVYSLSGTTSLQVADFNQDGIPDLALSTGNGVALLFGTGDGHFGQQTVFRLGRVAGRLAVADLNGDGRPDIAIEVDGALQILINPGFEKIERIVTVPFTPLLTKYWPSTVGLDGAIPLAVDLNGDGKPDIALADTTGVFTFLGNGDGTFTLAGSYRINAFGIAAGDFDGDGKPDLVVGRGDYVGNSFVAVLRGRGDGTFDAPTDVYSTSSLLPSLVVADFDRDGRNDIAVVENGRDRITVLRGTGPMTFAVSQVFSAGRSPFGMVVGDFDGDGLPDLLAADNGHGAINATGTVSLFRGEGAGGFGIAAGSSVIADSGRLPKPVVVADFDGDGVPDVAASNYTSGISIFLGKRNGLPALAGTAGPTIVQNAVVSALVAGDFNRDGRSDLVFAGGFVVATQGTAILISLGGGKFSVARTIGPPATTLAVCDFNGDGLLDVVAATTQGSLVVLFGRPDGTFQQSAPVATVATGAIVSSLLATDLNGDGKCDIAFTTDFGTAASGVFWIEGGGDGTFGSAIQIVDSQKDLGSLGTHVLTGLSAADWNGDGITDLAFGDLNDRAVFVLPGGGRFSSPIRIETADFVAQTLPADVNGDGILDLLLVKPDVNALEILEGTGDGRFLPLGQAVLGSDPASMAVGDFDVDGRTDVAVSDTGSSGGHVTFLMNLCGKRESVFPVRTPRPLPRVVHRGS